VGGQVRERRSQHDEQDRDRHPDTRHHDPHRPGRRVTLVTGPAAEFIDQQAAIGSRLALALTLLIGLPLLVLWLMTGSVVLPVRR
jgi:hypothetical protein